MTPAEQALLIDKQEFEAECQAARRRALQYSQQRRHAEQQLSRHWVETPVVELVTTNHNAEQRARIRRKAAREKAAT